MAELSMTSATPSEAGSDRRAFLGRSFAAFVCVPRWPRRTWVGAAGWQLLWGQPIPGDLIRNPFTTPPRVEVVIAHGYHEALGRCITDREPWADYAKKTFRGDGWIMPSPEGRATLDFVGRLGGLSAWPGRVNMLDTPRALWSLFADVPYAVRVWTP